MTTYMLGMPAEVRHRLRSALPRHEGMGPVVKVTCRDRSERACPAYDADHYEVQAYYPVTSAEALTALEEALQAMPGVYATTRVQGASDSVLAGNLFTNPEWPAPLGTARRDRDSLRPQVIALLADDCGAPQVIALLASSPTFERPGIPATRVRRRAVEVHGSLAG